MDETTPPVGLEALDRAIALVGLSKLADCIGVRYQLIQGWRMTGRKYATPAEHCPTVERTTGGAVRCEELRPDVDWAVLRSPDAPKAAACPEPPVATQREVA